MSTSAALYSMKKWSVASVLVLGSGDSSQMEVPGSVGPVPTSAAIWSRASPETLSRFWRRRSSGSVPSNGVGLR